MLLLMSKTLKTLVDLEGVRDGLGRMGLETTTSAECRPDAVICAPEDDGLRKLAREAGSPLLELRESWTGQGLSIGECPAGVAARFDRRPVRLFARYAQRLTPETEAAAADAATLPAPSAGASGRDAPGEVATASVACLSDDAAIWRALSRGREAICAGPCFASELDLAHSQDAASGGYPVMRRNVRDRTRSALAVECLYNTISPEAEMVAAALAEAARACVTPRSARVSVIVTAFNYADFVEDAIASAKDQTLAPAEIIVVDDGSTDGTQDLLSAIPDITVVTKPNGGQASAFNAGFAAASGEVVIFLDGDDRLSRDAVARAAAFDFAGVSRLQFLLETIDRAGRPTGLHPASHRAAAGDLRGALRADGVFWFMPTSGNAFPRRVLERLLPMPEGGFEIAADLYLVLGAALLGRTGQLPEVLGQYRVHGRNAYFHAQAGAPYLKDKRRSQRTKAWTALLEALPGLVPQADRRAIDADLRRLLRDATRESAPDPAEDPLGAAGKAHWPLVDTGDRLRFLAPEAGASALGAGWSDPGPLGAFPRETTAQIAVRLPPHETDWLLTIGYRVGGPPLRGVQFSLNGRMIDRKDILATGTLSLRLPAFLLPLDGSGGRPALVTVEFADEVGDRFGVLELRLDRLHGTGRPAPVLEAGQWHRVCKDSRAACALGRGWDWPDASGAAPAAQTSRLSFSFPRGIDRMLFLDWTGPGVPHVSCRGERLESTRGPVSGTVIVAMPASLGAVVDLDLVFAEIQEASRLRWVAWVPCDAGAPVAGAVVPMQDMLDASFGAAASVVLSPLGVSPSAGGARFRLRRAALPDGGLLSIELRRVSDPAGPLRCRVAVDGRCAEITVGGWTRVPFALNDRAEEAVVEIEVDGDAGDPILASVIWDAVPPGRAPPDASGTMSDLPLSPGLAPLWHPTSDGVSWLGASEGDFLLPDLPCTTTALMIRTLTLEAPFEQAMRVALLASDGDVLSEARCPHGLGEVALAVPAGARRDLRLRVASGHLVSADLLDAEPGPVLGGAVVSLKAV